MEQKKYLTGKERISYIIAAFGRSGIYNLMSMFLLIFYTDAVKMNPVTAGAIIVGCRVFDAFNDPIMGVIVDKTRSKWGRYKPYLLFSPALVLISTVLLFMSPFDVTENYTAAVIYAAVTYIFWGVCFTIQDVPFWGMSSAITPLETERNSFLSTARLGSTFGGILPTLVLPILAENMGSGKGYFLGGVIFAVLGACLSVIPFFTCKERVEPEEKAPTLRETVSVIFQNKVLLIMVISSILGSTMVMAQISSSYISTYLVTNKGIFDGWLMTAMSVAIGIGMVPSMVIMPVLRKKFDLKQIYIGSSAFGAIAHILCFLALRSGIGTAGGINVYILMVFLVFMGVPLGIYNVITYAIIADSVDYLEWKTGKNAGGVCFSFQTLLSKINAGIASLATSVMLAVFAFQQPTGDTPLPQSETTLLGLLIMVTLIPAAGFILTIIPMIFNDYAGEKKAKIQKELAQRREEAGSIQA